MKRALDPEQARAATRAARWVGVLGLLERADPRTVTLAQRLLEAGQAGAALTEAERFQLAEALSAAVYPKLKFSEFARTFLEDEPFLAYYRRFMDPDNWHSLDRKYVVRELLTQVAHLEGDLAECGVFRGATAYLLCEATRGTGKHVHLFDSFAGLSRPEAGDGDYWREGGLRAEEAEVRRSLDGFDQFTLYPGWIPARFPEVEARRFAFVHVDVDLYQPTRDSVEFFYPRLVPGAVLVLDDYGFSTCPGARRAVDQFFSARPERVLKLPTGQAFVIKR